MGKLRLFSFEGYVSHRADFDAQAAFFTGIGHAEIPVHFRIFCPFRRPFHSAKWRGCSLNAARYIPGYFRDSPVLLCRGAAAVAKHRVFCYIIRICTAGFAIMKRLALLPQQFTHNGNRGAAYSAAGGDNEKIVGDKRGIADKTLHRVWQSAMIYGEHEANRVLRLGSSYRLPYRAHFSAAFPGNVARRFETVTRTREIVNYHMPTSLIKNI
jgi:hypothetical protein